MIRFVAAAAAALLLSGAALAGTDMNFPVFTGINAHGGAKVILHHGTAQRVTVVKGDLSKADLHMSGNALDISPCKTWLSCWHTPTLEVEIVSPKIDAMEAHGGGSIKAVGDFPKVPSLNAEAHGGGAIDARAIPADTVNASAHGGGAIKVKALQNINAEAHGGGAISYAGNPPHVTSQAHGGGAIGRE
jgi:hypothetical protein